MWLGENPKTQNYNLEMIIMARKKVFWKTCTDCGKRFRAKSKRVRLCSTCRKEHKKASQKRANRKHRMNKTHQKLLDELKDKRYGYLQTRIHYNPNKDYFEHDDERYPGNLGDDYNDIYSRKNEDEDWSQYHYKLRNLKKNLGI